LLGGALTALAALVSVLCASLAWAHVRRVNALTSLDAASAARSLLRLPDEERAPELARRSVAGSWEHSLATELVGTSGDRARIAVVNDAVARIEQRLEEGAGWPRAALRLAVFSALLLAIVAYLIRSAEAVGPILGLGAIGALASHAAMRRARRGAKAQREAIDALVAAISSAISSKMEAHARPGHRHRARSRGRARA
jgi:hypothetical protein